MDFFSKHTARPGKSKSGRAAVGHGQNGNDTSAQAPPGLVPWVEKYRPESLRSVVSQEETIKVLEKSIQSKNLPHLLFYGPPGTGKTSTILALARDIYGHELFRSRILELNASDERGIQVVREKIKNFARTSVSNSSSARAHAPPYKIIILDEADSMTDDAQAALRRTMEAYSKSTRFCIICNYVSRIIEPLASRCAKFRFRRLPEPEIRRRLAYIAESEHISCTPEAMDALISVSEGDMRRAITSLQSAYHLCADKEVTDDVVREMAGVVPDKTIHELAQKCKRNMFNEMQQMTEDLILSGYSTSQVMQQIQDLVAHAPDLTSAQKARAALVFGSTDHNLNEGADEQLQLLNMVTQVAQIISA
ncbi:Subunit of heteropentameric Replication factor C (RF-C) [Spiromyces aspiralis]|uniref:Subunit of heteropentameric Replication factor C (RF-C) n=1 Tax=Spiromyces aspiralis TaxID=68401 RepID=A0ACC1HKT3_9FUNG|nr:Subunit of heteropentameric Replication factor C (RF-C) [Spiromyces aspiralis]